MDAYSIIDFFNIPYKKFAIVLIDTKVFILNIKKIYIYYNVFKSVSLY